MIVEPRYAWGNSAAPTTAVAITECRTYGSAVPGTTYPCGAAGMLFQVGSPPRWAVEASSAGDPAVIIPGSAAFTALGGAVWNQANSTAFTVVSSDQTYMFAFTATHTASEHVPFPPAYRPSPLFGLEGRGHSVIAWDVVLCVGRSAGSGDTLMVLAGGRTPAAIVDPSFPNDLVS